MGNIFSVVLFLGTPNAQDFYDLDLHFLPKILSPAATALGIWVVGNVGRERGSLLWPMLACYASVPLHFYGIGNNTITCLLGKSHQKNLHTSSNMSCVTGIIAFNYKSKEWERKVRTPPSTAKTVLILVLCGKPVNFSP